MDGIGKIALDISGDVNGLKNEPLLVSENALSLDKIPSLNVDTVITSPPYVNGTNYFRNTKIELWFLRCLNDKNDLTKYRAQALTAGINDVTVGKTRYTENSEVNKIVAMLQENAYDSRIPRMIGSYFSELTEVFNNMCKHLVDKATVAIDIGDSCYGGIHIPVDRLLSVCIYSLGFKERDIIELRKRRSKGGAILKQKLMVYQYNPNRTLFYVTDNSLSWKSGWEMFQTCVPHQQLPYAKRNWGHSLHSLCSYPGKMKPAIAHFLVDTFVPISGKVLDPFTGVGTIPFEAALQGKMSYGFEISPSAFAISMGKTQFHTGDKCQVVIKRLHSYINDGKPNEYEMQETRRFGFNGKLVDYYHPDTLNEIILARRFYTEYPARTPEEFFVLASLLHILHGNRPYALSRRSHPITPYKPTGNIEYRSLITRLEAKVARGLHEQLSPNFRPSKIFLQDATSWWPKEIEEIDAVITSPPFFDSTRFYLANWIRLWFCGWNQRDFEGRPLGFVEERQKTSFDVYVPVLRQAREHLKSNGVFVFHLGKSEKCNMSDKLLELGRKWFNAAEIFEESVAHCESHGIRDKGAVSFHQYLVLH
jgi:DNA modification methylase